MPTQTTVRFKIEVPTADVNGCTTNKEYSLTLSLLVEGPADGEIQVTLLEEEAPLVTPGEAPMPTDPPLN